MKAIHSALDWLGWERVSETKKRHQEIINLLKAMARTQAELEVDIINLNTQQLKIAKEQGDRFDAQAAAIAALEELIRQGTVSDGVEAALATLKATTQALDDSIPDVPAPPA